MMIKYLKKILPIALLIFIGACDSTTPKIGESEVGSKRIALMPKTHPLEADKDVHGFSPQLPATIINKSWPQVGFEASHIMHNPALADRPQEIWRTEIGKGSNSDFKLLARPVVADGLVFAMDAEGLVTALDAKTGAFKWEFDTTQPGRDHSAISGGLGIEEGILYVTTGFGEVIALRATDSATLWRRVLPNPIRAAPTIFKGRVYVVSIDNELFALDGKKGTILWQHQGISESATLMGASSPAGSEDSVVVAYSSGEIYNLRAENGRASWNYTLMTPTQVGALPAIADIRGLPVIDHGRIFAISHSGRVAAIDERTGDRVWEADVGGLNTPILTANTIFVLSGEGQLVALARDSGRIVWIHDLQHLVDPTNHDSDPIYWTGPVLANSRLWLVNSLGQLSSFSPNDGSWQATLELETPIYVAPIVAEGILYIVTDDAQLIALK